MSVRSESRSLTGHEAEKKSGESDRARTPRNCSWKGPER